MSFYRKIFTPDKKITVITGFNTDINYEGVTYHVQTEDKGLRTPLILSLVYQAGTILASKRSPYDDLLTGKFDEKILEDRLNRQHKLICAAIRAGRIEDLKRMTVKESAEKGLAATKEVVKKTKKQVILPIVEKVVEKIPPIVAKVETKEPLLELDFEEKVELKPKEDLVAKELEKSIPKPTDEPVWDIPIVEDVIIIEEDFSDASQILEEEIVLPPDAVEIIGDLEQFGALLDDELKVKILGENKFKSGDRKNINILVCRGNDDRAVGDSDIMVKIVGSDFRPLIYHAKADSNGVAAVFLKLPRFRSGRAAILVRAMIEGEETELRRVITPE